RASAASLGGLSLLQVFRRRLRQEFWFQFVPRRRMLIRSRNPIESGGNMSAIPNDQSSAKAHDGFGVASFTLGAIAMLSFGTLSIYATAFNKTGAANSTIGACLLL